MKLNLYPKLAWYGISKNKKVYLPFIFTSIGITMMYYIVSYLTYSKAVYEMRGGRQMQLILSWGTAVVAVFAVIFLFYMNSFLMRRRKTEFGLYNILGMGKWNIAQILLWQNIMLSTVSLTGGLGLGILLSKLSELCAAKLLNSSNPLGFTIEPIAIRNTIILTIIEFGIILIYSLGQIHVSKPVELLRGEKVGEKPPKARWILAIIGVLILGGAYYLAITIEEPMAAIGVFFIAVVMVIISSYILFICGSVTLCKALQKNKRYYYKTNHFVSVSSMAYRMKRNGASLASICILSTTVLVMMSSSLCLYIGSEDSLRNQYPKDISIMLSSADDNSISIVNDTVDKTIAEYDVVPEKKLQYQNLNVTGLIEKNQISLNPNDEAYYVNYNNVLSILFFTLDEYNRLTGQSEELSDNEVFVHMFKNSYSYDTIQFGNSEPMNVKKQSDNHSDDMKNVINAQSFVSEAMYIVVSDNEAMEKIYAIQKEAYGTFASDIQYYYEFDLNEDADIQIAIIQDIKSKLTKLTDNGTINGYRCLSMEENRLEFIASYGGLLFLGILLSIVMLFGTVLIMYYKQISEGYEDASRFKIMQKVGMTKDEIRKSINSQVLTVFAAPLLAAGIHTGFAFPLIHRLLLLFGLTNITLLIIITIVSFLIFALFYVLMYWLTSRSYYQLVK